MRVILAIVLMALTWGLPSKALAGELSLRIESNNPATP